MKLHYFLFAVLFCLINHNPLWAQNFAPIGAEWCFHGRDTDYEYVNNAGPVRTNWVDHVVVEKDTLVAGVECRMLSVQRSVKTNYNPELTPKQ